MIVEIAASPGDTNFSMSSLSPLTGIIEETDVIIDFGQFEGHSVSELKTTNPDLYDQLIKEKEQDILAIRRGKDKTFRLYVNPLLNKSNA